MKASEAIKVGDGLTDGSTMGPLANDRRVQAMDSLIADAVQRGGVVCMGGARIGNKGNFFQPTVLTDVPVEARIMNEEPFGPIAVMMPFRDADKAIAEANRLPYGLALPETPFGGMKDSGYGSEGGTEGLEAYLTTKFVTQAAL